MKCSGKNKEALLRSGRKSDICPKGLPLQDGDSGAQAGVSADRAGAAERGRSSSEGNCSNKPV